MANYRKALFVSAVILLLLLLYVSVILVVLRLPRDAFTPGEYYIEYNTTSNATSNLTIWDNVQKCPNSTFAVGLNLAKGNNSWLKHIKLLCSGNQSVYLESTLNPSQVTETNWGEFELCTNDSYINGFRLRYDNTKTEFVKRLEVQCSDKETDLLNVDTPGDWLDWKKCNTGHAVVGMQVQHNNDTDQYAFTNVRFICGLLEKTVFDVPHTNSQN